MEKINPGKKNVMHKKTCSTCSSVILRNGEPPPIAAYPSLLLGARKIEINFAKGH